VGRDAELALADAELRTNGVIVIAGRGGVGKTRLLRAIGGRAAEAGGRVVSATGTRAAGEVPLGALAHLVPSGGVDVGGGSVVSSIVATLAENVDAGGRRLVCVDDAHLLDSASALLVQSLARSVAVDVAIAIRTDEAAPDAVVALWKDDAATRLELQPLSESEVDALVRARLGGPVDSGTRRMLWESTRGNALFLRELVHEGLARGVLDDRSGMWRWDGPPTVGPTLRELITTRLATLEPLEHDALEVVAIGEPVPLGLLTELVGGEPVEALERKGFLEIERDGARRVARAGHPLFAEVLRADAPTSGADGIRVRLAAAFDRRGARRHDDRLRVATLLVDAGAPAERSLLIDAAREAWARGDTDLVESLANAVLRFGPDPEAAYLIGEVLANRNRYEQAVTCWRAVLAGECEDSLRVLAATAAASVLALTLGRSDESEAVLADAERIVESHALLARLAAARTAVFVHYRPDEEIGATADTLLAAAGTANETQVWAWIGSARLRITGGELDSVIAESASIHEFAAQTRTEWPLSTMFVAICRFFALHAAGRLDAAEQLSATNLEAALAEPFPAARSAWVEGLGIVAYTRGELDVAWARLSEAAAISRDHDSGSLRVVLHELAYVAALRGNGDLAEQLLDEAGLALQGLLEPIVPAARVRAAALAAAGRVEVARRLLRGLAEDVRSEGPYHELFVLHDLARTDGAVEAAPRLAELADRFDGTLAALYRDHAVALAQADADALDDVTTRCVDLGLWLDAAETATAAASVRSRVGDDRRAVEAARRAGELAARCGGARTPLLARHESPPLLTPREQEVADLAAAGSTDAQIAGQLFVSVRTVHAHLRSVFSKLGIRSRGDLPSALAGGPAPELIPE